MRTRLEAGGSSRNLKRAAGGLADVEFAVQLLQLRHGRELTELMTPNVWDALTAAEIAGVLAKTDAAALRSGYGFLRTVEARLRVVTDRPLVELPDGPADAAKLARRLGFASAEAFRAELERTMSGVRRAFDAVCGVT